MNDVNLKQRKTIADYLWGIASNPWVLIIATFLVMFFMLGAKEIWTQEWRWANICHQMMLRHDYLHPFLAGRDYYDKPLLSYWAMIGMSYITGALNVWAIRLPNAIAGVIAVWCTYILGKKCATKQTGLIAAWLLISSFFFIYWARTASADMLNVAGILAALAWYFARKDQPGFWTYAIFFLIVAVASLFKGIVAAAVVFLVLIPELLAHNNWKKHLRISFFLGMIPALIVYLLPFWASNHFNPSHYGESGLYLVFRENILRYVKPFDNKGPIYTYLVFLPLYIFPWIFFLIPALYSNIKKWKHLEAGSRWFMWSLALTFLFFTGSGSRRNYYVLPMLPFAILVTADWIRKGAENHQARNRIAGIVALIFFIFTFGMYAIVYPFAYSGGGIDDFAKTVRHQAEQIRPWKEWHITMLDAKTKTSFYLDSPNLITFLDAKGNIKNVPTTMGLLDSFPILLHDHKNNILILRRDYIPHIKFLLHNYQVIYKKRTRGDRFTGKIDPTAPVALIPKQSIK